MCDLITYEDKYTNAYYLTVGPIESVTMVGRPPAVGDLEILTAVLESIESTTAPVATTRETAAKLPIKREGVGRRLNDLVDRELLSRKDVGASYVWWLPNPITDLITALDTDQVDPTSGTDDVAVASRLEHAFEIGRSQFDLEVGVIARVDPDRDHFEVEYVTGVSDALTPGTELPLSETYCTEPIIKSGPASITDPREQGFASRAVYEEYGIHSYLGTVLEPDSLDNPRTFFFAAEKSRSDPFTTREYEIHDLLGGYIEGQLVNQGPMAEV